MLSYFWENSKHTIMSFIKNNSVAAILIALAFAVVGYGMGKVSSGQEGCHNAHSECSHEGHEGCKGHDHGDHSKCSHGHGEELIIVETLKADGFEGDTTITMSGGEIKLSIKGEDVEVEVEIDEEHYDGDVNEVHKEIVIVKTTTEDE